MLCNIIEKYYTYSIFSFFHTLLILSYFIFQAIVDKLNSQGDEINILLLSLTAGGVGLNLVGANHLLLTDIHWNPQLEAQAQDRIYRFGQKKNVFIYK